MIRLKLTSGKWSALLVGGVLAAALCSCNSSMIYDDLPECVPEYRLRLSYDHNLAREERVNRVDAAEVYAFDAEGNLAYSVAADRQTLEENDWTLPLKLNRDQPYDLVVWGGLISESPFSLDGAGTYLTREDLTCRLATEKDASGNASSQKRFPGLYHSTTSVTYTLEDGYEERTAKLIKNTNTLDVMLRRLAGSPVGVNQYVIRVVDANGVMAHDNSVSGDNVHYYPVEITDGMVEIPDGNGGVTGETKQGITAEMHLARLMNEAEPKLIITEASSGKEMFNVDLKSLLLKAKEFIAPDMDDQEYLDRQDEYDVQLVLPSDEDWNHIAIYVNNWVIVYDEIEWH